MFTIKNDLNGELIVNKSRFITYVYKVNNVLEVNEKIDALKAKYKDATHYCYSYIIDNINYKYKQIEQVYLAQYGSNFPKILKVWNRVKTEE